MVVFLNGTRSPITVIHNSPTYLISFGDGAGDISCQQSNPAIKPGISLAIYT